MLKLCNRPDETDPGHQVKASCTPLCSGQGQNALVLEVEHRCGWLLAGKTMYLLNSIITLAGSMH
jgi:hypothetical protein